MYLVTKLFDDDYIEIVNLADGSTRVLTVQEQREWYRNTDVYGLSITKGNNIYSLSYDFRRFDTEHDALEFCNEIGIASNNIVFTDNNWFVFRRTNKVWHVSYYVYTSTELETTYIGPRNSYTPYKQAAKEFKKEEAYIKANTMTKNSKTGKKWCVLRYFSPFQ